MPQGIAQRCRIGCWRATISRLVCSRTDPAGARITSDGIRYSNMLPDHEISAEPAPIGVAARPKPEPVPGFAHRPWRWQTGLPAALRRPEDRSSWCPARWSPPKSRWTAASFPDRAGSRNPSQAKRAADGLDLLQSGFAQRGGQVGQVVGKCGLHGHGPELSLRSASSPARADGALQHGPASAAQAGLADRPPRPRSRQARGQGPAGRHPPQASGGQAARSQPAPAARPGHRDRDAAAQSRQACATAIRCPARLPLSTDET